MTALLRSLAMTLALLFAAPAFAAQDSQGADSPQRTTAFVAAEVPQEVPGGKLLLAAYGLVWAVLFGYLVSVRRRQREVEDEVRELLAEARELRADKASEG